MCEACNPKCQQADSPRPKTQRLWALRNRDRLRSSRDFRNNQIRQNRKFERNPPKFAAAGPLKPRSGHVQYVYKTAKDGLQTRSEILTKGSFLSNMSARVCTTFSPLNNSISTPAHNPSQSPKAPVFTREKTPSPPHTARLRRRLRK